MGNLNTNSHGFFLAVVNQSAFGFSSSDPSDGGACAGTALRGLVGRSAHPIRHWHSRQATAGKREEKPQAGDLSPGGWFWGMFHKYNLTSSLFCALHCSPEDSSQALGYTWRGDVDVTIDKAVGI